MSTSTLDRDRKWFLETFSKASQLESRLIPDILGAKEGSVVKAVFPVSIDLPDDVLRTAFGLTLSVWSADTKACFSTAWGDAPESPVFVEWTPETPLKELTDAVRKQL